MDWIGLRIDDADGSRLGRVEDVYSDPAATHARWLLVRLGLFGERRVLVPAASAAPDSGRVWVPFPRERVRDSVAVVPGELLTTPEEAAACIYWGLAPLEGASRPLTSAAAA